MLKYYNYDIVFEEIPDKVTLAINITNCQNNCVDCHSSYLKEDIGSILDIDTIDFLIDKFYGINCILFMGEGNDKTELLKFASYIRNKNLLVALYSGNDIIDEDSFLYFDYIKIGHYNKKYGPLNKKSTNQKLYKIENTQDNIIINDITYKLWNEE
jgi:anaerobic ribonucleoside-triphosphate reductase activating protein